MVRLGNSVEAEESSPAAALVLSLGPGEKVSGFRAAAVPDRVRPRGEGLLELRCQQRDQRQAWW